MESKEIKMRAIGFVRRESKGEDIRNRSLTCEIVIHEDVQGALDGLEDFSHVFVLFYMHKVPTKERLALKVHPRGRSDLPLVGVFATRSAFRPNPLGLTLAELLERKDNVLTVRGLDAFDGTPVVDLKPADSRDMVLNPRIPTWLEELHGESSKD